MSLAYLILTVDVDVYIKNRKIELEENLWPCPFNVLPTCIEEKSVQRGKFTNLHCRVSLTI